MEYQIGQPKRGGCFAVRQVRDAPDGGLGSLPEGGVPPCWPLEEPSCARHAVCALVEHPRPHTSMTAARLEFPATDYPVPLGPVHDTSLIVRVSVRVPPLGVQIAAGLQYWVLPRSARVQLPHKIR
jgi:hypothetical protein